MTGTTGPSTSQTPYLVGLEPNVSFVSILSAGDQVGTKSDGTTPWVFVGIPDGIGAFDNEDGTITVLVNHELGSTNGAVREHGATGAFVSQLTVDKATLAVLDAKDAAETVYTDADGDGVWVAEPVAINRLCSADLPAVSAFFYAGADGIVGTADDVGTTDRIFMNGEEAGSEGRAFAWVVTGDEAGTAWELPALGNFSWENSVASPDSGAKTVVIGTDDATPGQVYVYVGEKQATGKTVEQAGLTNGILYGIKAQGIGNGDAAENVVGTVPETGTFELVALPDAATQTGAELDAESDLLGITEFARPEDAAWDTVDPNRMYFATTGAGAAPARLWAFTFTDLADPTLGGTFELLLDGTEGAVSLDNLTVDAEGKVWLVEDPGSATRSAKTWVYDPATDSLDLVAQHDVARFGDEITPATPPFTTNEEASGIVDVTDLLGDSDTQAFLVDVQAHYPVPDPEIVEGGQLLVMYVDAPTDGTAEADTVRGGYTDDSLNAFAGDDLILGGSGNDSLDGGTGADSMEGMAGDDTYTVDDAGDVVTEAAGMGTDTVLSTVAFTLGADVENLVLLGDARIEGTGNDLDNRIEGNDGRNRIEAGGGNDILLGGAGRDLLRGGLGDDVLEGGDGNDRMNGQKGNDVLTGGEGADIFAFAALKFGQDVVTDFEVGTDTLELHDNGFTSLEQLMEFTIDTAEGAKILVSPLASILLAGVTEAELLTADIVLM